MAFQSGKNGTFRYIIAPMPEQDQEFFSGLLPYNTEPAQYGSAGSQFMSNAITYLVDGNDHNWGSLIGVASIKYVVVLFNVSSPQLSQWYVQGQPRFSVGMGLPVGDPHIYFSLLSNQTDMHLIKSNSNYAIFQNLVWKPIVQQYQKAANLIGSCPSASQFPNLFNSTLLFHNNSEFKGLPTVFSNSNPLNCLLNNASIPNVQHVKLSTGGGWVYESIRNWTLPLSYDYPLNRYINSGNNFLQATGPATVNYSAKGMLNSTRYDIFAKVLFAAESNGKFSISGGNKTFSSPMANVLDITPHFSWIKLGSFESTGNNTIIVKNINGYSALAGIDIIPTNTANKLLLKEDELFSSNSSYYFSENPFVWKRGRQRSSAGFFRMSIPGPFKITFKPDIHFKVSIEITLSVKSMQPVMNLEDAVINYKTQGNIMHDLLIPLRNLIFHYDDKKAEEWVTGVMKEESYKKPIVRSLSPNELNFEVGNDFNAHIYSEMIFFPSAFKNETDFLIEIGDMQENYLTFVIM